MKGSGIDEVNGQTSIGLVYYSLTEESHVTLMNSNQMIWEKYHGVVVPIVENQNLARETSHR